MRKTTIVLSAALGLVSVVAVYLQLTQSLLASQIERVQQRELDKKAADLRNDSIEKIPQEALNTLTLYPPPISTWQKRDRDLALKALSQEQYDVLVVPFQVDGHALDHTARSLMTLSLGHRLATGTELKVADPVLVARVFGSTARTIDEQEIARIASVVGVSHAVTGKVGHNRDGAYSLQVRLRTLDGGNLGPSTSDIQFSQPEIPFDKINIPYFSFLKYRDSVIKTLFPDNELNAQKTVTALSLPQPANEVVSATTELEIPSLNYMQFLGALHPEKGTGRARELLFERTLILAEYLEDKDVTLIKARALLSLNRRSAAMSVLSNGRTESLRELEYYANGNYLPSNSKTLKHPLTLNSLITEILTHRLRLGYGHPPDASRVFEIAERYEKWGALLNVALVDKHIWQGRSSVKLKHALDMSFPEPSFSISAFKSRQLLSPSIDPEYDLTNLVMNHLDLVRDQHLEERGMGPRVSDYVELIQAMLIHGVVERIRHVFQAKGQTESALRLAEQYAPLMQGEPEYTLLVGNIQLGSANSAKGVEKTNLRSEGVKNKRNVFRWIGQVTPDTSRIVYNWAAYFPEYEDLPIDMLEQQLFTSDWPIIPMVNLWSPRIQGFEDNNNECLDNTISNFQCFLEVYHGLDDQDRNIPVKHALLEELRHRFISHPDRLTFLAKAKGESGNQRDVELAFLEAIQQGTTDWSAYKTVGRNLIKKSLYQEALDVIVNYPGFNGVEVSSRVLQSNRAYDIGSLFFWAGAYEQAAVLYTISTSFNTGSGGEMASKVRLALIDGNYAMAAEASLQRARRYQSKYAIRDLIGLTTMMGDNEWAWSLIDGLQEKFDQPELWTAALIAHRASNATSDEIATWASADVRAGEDKDYMKLPLRHVFMAATVDRTVSPSLASRLVEIDKREPLMTDDSGFILDGNRVKSQHHFFGQTEKRPEPNSAVKRRLVYAAEALAAIYQKNHELAFTLLDEASRTDKLGEFLPYYAWTSAKVGNTLRVEKYLKKAKPYNEAIAARAVHPEGLHFDEFLAQAFMNSVRGEHESALDFLALANSDVLHTQSRTLFTRYQIMETAWLIYQDTGVDTYRVFLLDLAQRNAIIEPIQAYSHSFVAMTSKDSSERVNALARVLILDPQSRCLALAKQDELEKAKKLAALGYVGITGEVEDGI